MTRTRLALLAVLGLLSWGLIISGIAGAVWVVRSIAA